MTAPVRRPTGGRSPTPNSIRATAARASLGAIAALSEIVADAGTPAEARIKAAAVLLAHAMREVGPGAGPQQRLALE